MKIVPKLRFPGFTDEWQVKKLGQLLTIGSGRDYKHLKPGDIPVYGTGGLMLHVNDYLYDGKSIGIGRKGTIDKPQFLQGKFWTVDTLFYTHDYKQSSPEFLYAIFQKINWQQWNEASGVPSLSKSTIEKIKVIVPREEEQEKIAGFLTAVDERIGAIDKKLGLLQKYKKGIMQKIFTQKIRFKDKNGKSYPDWKEKTIKQLLISYKLGGDYLNSETRSNFPLMKMGNLGRGFFNLKKIEYIPTGSKIDVNDRMEFNDLFFNTRNTLDLVGKVSIWKNELPEAYYNSNLMRLRFPNNEFMNYYLNSFNGLKKLKRLATGTTSVAAIYTKDLLKIKLSIPELAEQEKIADFLIALDDKIKLVEKELEQAKAFKKALLQRMFV